MTNIFERRLSKKLSDVAHQLGAYMEFRAAHEGVAYGISSAWYCDMLSQGVRVFFGVVVSEDGLIEDLRRPELFAEWMKRVIN
jgi:hypothetical protein